ncbi:MAG: bifunctional diguanylate cyclase/phosphodiesterase, partial [Spirochaetales bacterium]
LISGVVTLVSTHTSDNFTEFPIWLIEFLKVIYYILLPAVIVLVFLYAKRLEKPKNSAYQVSFTDVLLLLPYVLYIATVLSNYIFHGFFTISPEAGYVRGPLYQLPYAVALFYTMGVFVLAVKNRNSSGRKTGFILSLMVIVLILISAVQFFFSYLLLTGLANVTGLLIIHIYVQNVKKSQDTLTGVYNRDALIDHLTKLIKSRSQSGFFHYIQQPFVLAVFSLRNFKSINDRYGLQYGNGLLESIAKHIENTVVPYNVYRYGGDEFAVVIEKKDNKTDALIQKIADRFNEPFASNEGDGEIKTLVDMVYARVDFPAFGKTVRKLLTAVDYSVDSLKHSVKKSNYLYDISVSEAIRRRNQVIERIKDAVANDGFEVHYQAVWSTEEKCFSGAEALIRMKDSFSYPSEFIPLAEEIGLITEITYIVIEKCCADLRRIIDMHGEDIDLQFISINFPYEQFLETDMPSKVMHILDSHNVSPKWIKVEITERALIDDTTIMANTMSEMRTKGFAFELDDFGVEYSNISILLNLPIDIIKIDRSLMLAVTSNKENERFFDFIIQAIQFRDKLMVVEGVEEKNQAEYFESHHCDYIQGYYYAKPLPVDDFIDFLVQAHKENTYT